MNKKERQNLVDIYNYYVDVNAKIFAVKLSLEDIMNDLYLKSNMIKRKIYLSDKGLTDEELNIVENKEYKSTRPDTYK